MPDYIKRRVVRWQPNTNKFKDELRKIAVPPEQDKDTLNVLVMNTEAFSTEKGTNVAIKFLRNNPRNITVIDESTTIKNKGAVRTKNLIKVGEASKSCRRILTGSPISKSPMDLFTQCAFLDNKALGFNSYYSFQSRYAIVRRRTLGAHSFQEVTGYQRLDELGNKLDEFTHRVFEERLLGFAGQSLYTQEIRSVVSRRKFTVRCKSLLWQCWSVASCLRRSLC